MKRRTAVSLMVTIVGGAIAAGSGLTAWATWAVSATPVQGLAQTGQLPGVENLAVRANGKKLTFSWNEARFASGAAVGGYRVVATAGAFLGTACEATGGSLTCVYTPSGRPEGTFVVRALAGSKWIGPASAAVTYAPGNENLVLDAAVGAAEPTSTATTGGSKPKAKSTPKATETAPTTAPTGTSPTAATGTTPGQPTVSPGTAGSTPTETAGTAGTTAPAE
ncbi:hypothetical protein [Actinoplanes regularis]|uniref:Fibronectin type-III domain-containing protein n=1 Tax=Actinoplanes regularis TaxID=52697 RepID=A0A238V9Q5_9ACTN|nr:hypothetical protein [Actinoplanes regularis]GIE83777.1 hypothetical protein Are01nite_02570 [Actinoplanes regularis]SNR30279.1 hypothetical protein SAMN06264365_101815 [Actinoplanes regularis]